ncbi:hypothetical protein BGZ51_000708 [Haplosporangium sp. Z 767]|nr:hypothetical protein BGZ51_000708 [Haplosporangium sp. Z 767]
MTLEVSTPTLPVVPVVPVSESPLMPTLSASSSSSPTGSRPKGRIILQEGIAEIIARKRLAESSCLLQWIRAVSGYFDLDTR